MNAPESKHTPARGPVDGRVLATENEEQVLVNLHRFGWLPTRTLTAIVWPDATSPRVAQRTLVRLREAGEVASALGKDGATCYALAAAGARRVTEVFGFKASGVKDLGRRLTKNYDHRNVANEVCLWWSHASIEGANHFETEHQISLRKATINLKKAHFLSRNGKVPDALLFQRPPAPNKKGDSWHVWWVEAESGHKNIKKQQHMCAELAHILGHEGSQMTVERLDAEGHLVRHRVTAALVSCPKPVHEERLVRFMLKFLKGTWFNSYDGYYIKDHCFVLRPDGSHESIAAIVARTPELKAYDRSLKPGV